MRSDLQINCPYKHVNTVNILFDFPWMVCPCYRKFWPLYAWCWIFCCLIMIQMWLFILSTVFTTIAFTDLVSWLSVTLILWFWTSIPLTLWWCCKNRCFMVLHSYNVCRIMYIINFYRSHMSSPFLCSIWIHRLSFRPISGTGVD